MSLTGALPYVGSQLLSPTPYPMPALEHLGLDLGDPPRHAEIGDLADLVVVHQHVPRSQVSVNNLEEAICQLNRRR